MTVTTVTSREFNQDVGRAKNAAKSDPVRGFQDEFVAVVGFLFA